MQSISSLSCLHGPTGAWMSTTMLYYRKKNNKKPKAIRPLFAITPHDVKLVHVSTVAGAPKNLKTCHHMESVTFHLTYHNALKCA